jgi:hypothetical protein
MANRTSSSSFSIKPMVCKLNEIIHTFQVRNKLLNGVFYSYAKDDCLESMNSVDFKVNFFCLHFFLKESESVNVFHFFYVFLSAKLFEIFNY